jgi:mannose-6-phosphate isomerase-like protein (cupin superfamily)
VSSEPIVLRDKLAAVREHWSPRIIAEVNDTHVKVAKLLGEFDWHHHEAEDELFWVVDGRLLIQFRDRDVWLGPGELLLVPRGVEHRPVAHEEVQLVLIEPATTLNTGNIVNERTRHELDRI